VAWTVSFWILIIPAFWYVGRPIGFGTGGRLIRHARYFILQLAESQQLAETHLTWSLFRLILGRIERLAWHPT
jgi:hypothetical protein